MPAHREDMRLGLSTDLSENVRKKPREEEADAPTAFAPSLAFFKKKLASDVPLSIENNERMLLWKADGANGFSHQDVNIYLLILQLKLVFACAQEFAK